MHCHIYRRLHQADRSYSFPMHRLDHSYLLQEHGPDLPQYQRLFQRQGQISGHY